MKRGRFTEEQLIEILKEQEAGHTTAEVCRRQDVSLATFYKWKAKCGGLEALDAKRLRSLEDENARLKKLLADTMRDNAMLKDVALKNGDARLSATCHCSFACGAKSGRAAGVSYPWRGSFDRALPISAV